MAAAQEMAEPAEPSEEWHPNCDQHIENMALSQTKFLLCGFKHGSLDQCSECDVQAGTHCGHVQRETKGLPLALR